MSDVGSTPTDENVRASQDEWRASRRFLNRNRARLAARAAALYPNSRRVAATPLLSRPGWMLPSPLDLRDVRLSWEAGAPRAAAVGREPESEGVRPLRTGRLRFETYAQAVEALDRPRLFEDRPAYRLVGVDLAAHRRLAFSRGRYFDVVNVAEAVAHEYAAVVRAGREPGWADLVFRSLIGDPFDLSRRPLTVAMSALTLRRDRASGAPTFVLHWRDPRRVATGGGMYQVMPVGVFQPAGDSAGDRASDFDLWRGLVREYAEEFLGTPERADGAVSYEAWPFFQAMSQGRSDGVIQARCFGIGVDPLTLVADVLVTVVFDADAFDRLLGGAVESNEEGTVATAGSGRGFPFSRPAVEEILRDRPMQPAGAAVLALAWEHRAALLGSVP